MEKPQSRFSETALRRGEIIAELKGVSGKQGLLIMIWKTVYEMHPSLTQQSL